FFLTNFGEQPGFMRLGEGSGRVPFLEQVLGEGGGQLFPKKAIPLGQMMLVRIPEDQFIHGTVTIEGRLASVLYFDDIHKGMLAILWSVSPPETKYVRFTGRALYEALGRSSN